MHRGRASLLILVSCSLVACNYIVGYNKLRKVNRNLKLLPDGAVTFAATQVQLGASHTCATYADRSLRCWGRNDAGQLGIGGTDDALVPTLVPDVSDVTSISLGERHTCVTRANGETWCWGANDHGQLGTGAADAVPHDRPALTLGAPAERVHAGRSHTCIETQASTIECFGANDYGQLGDGTSEARAVPTPVSGLKEVLALATGGGDHTCAVATDDGGARRVYCWGRNDAGQTGQPLATSSSRQPTIVEGALAPNALSIGRSHSCASTDDGALLCWGANDRGQLGDGSFAARIAPRPVNDVTDVTDLGSMGAAHSCSLSDGIAQCWGSNQFGQLGSGDVGGQRALPARVAGEDWSELATNGEHVCGIRDGDVLCFGRNDAGQLGLGHRIDTPTPTPTL
jgi:alpha-tubulin suppressor-like RCC1 family protein